MLRILTLILMIRVLEIAVGVVLLILLATMIVIVLIAAFSGENMPKIKMHDHDDDGILITCIRNTKSDEQTRVWSRRWRIRRG